MRVALGQIFVDMDDRAGNLGRAEAAVAEGAGAGADLVGLPECMDLGWLNERDVGLAEPVPGPLTETYGSWAAAHGVYLVAGMTERAADGRVYNAAVMFDRKGALVHRHRKISVLGIAAHIYTVGRSAGVVETEFGRIGVHICADAFPSAVTGVLGEMGARLVVSPCSWAVDAGNEETNIAWLGDRYRDRTTETDIYLVGVDNIGEVKQGVWRGKIVQGDSLVFGPGGEKLLQGPRNEAAVLTVDLPIEPVD